MVKKSLSVLRVARTHGTRGILRAGPLAIPVALGRSGIAANKFEGDGATPRGRFQLLRLWWRADRSPRPPVLLPTRRMEPEDAWCEDPVDRRYNRPIKLSSNDTGDRLWHNDNLYDFVIELDHNTRPRIARRGSAVFIHVARLGLSPTAGCIALPAPTLRKLLPRLSAHAVIEIR